MKVLKFWHKEETTTTTTTTTTTDPPVLLENNLRLEDITDDVKTAMIDKEGFIRPDYRIGNSCVYMACNDLVFTLSTIFNPKPHLPIHAMLIRYKQYRIIIVPAKSYVFWNGRSVDPVEWKISQKITVTN